MTIIILMIRPIIPVIRPAVETPVGLEPSFFAFDIAAKITPSSDGTIVQHETKPTHEHMSDAIANPSVVFC